MNTAKRKYTPLALLLSLVLCTATLRAQVVLDADNGGRRTAHPAAALEIHSSDRGVLIPRLTYIQRQYVPVDSLSAGLIVYQTDKAAGFYLYDGKAWKCLNPIDLPPADDGEPLTFATVAFTGSYADLKDKPVIPPSIEGLSKVAYSGSYKDLTGCPEIPVITDSAGNEQQMDFAKVALTGNYLDLNNRPDIPKEVTGLSAVATSGSYKDLSNTPKIPTKLSEIEQNEYYRTVSDADKKRWNAAASRSLPTRLSDLKDDYEHTTATSADIARWNAAASVKVPSSLSDLREDSLHRTVSDADKARWDAAAERKVPTTLSDLSPDYAHQLVSEQEKDAWNEASSRSTFSGRWNDIVGKPTFSDVALSGDYADLKDKPVIPTALSDFKEDEFCRTVTDEEKVRWSAKSTFSGSWNDLTDRPTIPTTLRQLEQDEGNKLVSEKDIARWNAVSAATSFNGSYHNLTDRPIIPTKLSELEASEFNQTVSRLEKAQWNAAADAVIPDSLRQLTPSFDGMFVTAADLARWNASSSRTIPQRLKDLKADSSHQLVSNDDKAKWNAATNKVNNLPQQGKINQWQGNTDVVTGYAANWSDMAVAATALKNNFKVLTNKKATGGLKEVAYSGNYYSLNNRPFIPDAFTITKWNSYMKNGSAPLSKVALDGRYADLTVKASLAESDLGDVVGDLENTGLSLKSDRTLSGTVTTVGKLQAQGEEGNQSNAKISIKAVDNVFLQNPITMAQTANSTYDDCAVSVGVSKEMNKAQLSQYIRYVKEFIPEGVVMMTTGSILPCWAEFTPLRGRFPVGINNEFQKDSIGGEDLHLLKAEELPPHEHKVTIRNGDYTNMSINAGGQRKHAKPGVTTDNSSGTDNYSSTLSATYLNNQQYNNPIDIRPPYYAVKFIIRDNKTCDSEITNKVAVIK